MVDAPSSPGNSPAWRRDDLVAPVAQLNSARGLPSLHRRDPCGPFTTHSRCFPCAALRRARYPRVFLPAWGLCPSPRRLVARRRGASTVNMPARGSSRDVGVARRRTQFSSCDECRRSRVGCDALSQGTRDDEPGACTRCQNRNKQCTFKVCLIVCPRRRPATADTHADTPNVVDEGHQGRWAKEGPSGKAEATPPLHHIVDD